MLAREKLVIYEVEQNTPDWYMARLGKPTASEFAAILANDKGRTTILRKLAGEVVTNAPAENYTNAYMDRGKRMEAEARDWYARRNFIELERVGFIFNPDVGAGWSPDSLVGKEGAIETKTVAPHLLIPILEKGVPPGEHEAQCRGGALLVGRRRWIDLVLYWPGMPKFIHRYERDVTYEDKLSESINAFNADLRKLVRKLKAMRGMQ